MNEHLRTELSKEEALEKQLIQTQKMESIGQLTAGVAHEINNSVGFVLSDLNTLTKYISLFKQLIAQYMQLANSIKTHEQGSDNKEIHEILEAIATFRLHSQLDRKLSDVDDLLLESQEGTKRIQEIVQNLKSFSRMNDVKMTQININDCLESTLKIIWNELKYICEVKKDLGDLPLIIGNAGQLSQVFMNLLLNAAHAVKKQGLINIKTLFLEERLLVQIADNGSGISPEIIPHIFDPFFTTKPPGKGSGLGLSISYDIIQKHQGMIDVQSKVGKGTTFTISLPVHKFPSDQEHVPSD